MQLWQINKAVLGLCDDVEKAVKVSSCDEMSEARLIHELVVCILGSGVRYEIAVSFAKLIKRNRVLAKKNILDYDLTYSHLKVLLGGAVNDKDIGRSYARYRYPDRGSRYIARSLFNIYTEHKSLKSLLDFEGDLYCLRRKLIRLCPGIGPKQASHFLKNAGYTDKVAILDRHILKYMELSEDRKIPINKIGKIDFYEDLENRFLDVAKKFKYSISVVDQSMWFVMRAINKESFA